MRVITEEDLLQVLGHAARDPLQPGSEGRRRRHRPGDVDPDRLRQAAPAAGGQARGRLRDGGDRGSAGDRRVRRPAHAAVARGAAVPGAVAADPRGHQRRLRPQGGQGRRSRRRENEDDEGGSEELVDILEITDEAPIIRWVNSLLFNAVKERASDIHIEPGEKEVIVRYRIDGELYESRARGAPVHAVDHLAREDHGGAQHRREAAAAGRAHPPQDRRQGHRHARRDRADGQAGRAHHHPSARSRIGAARSCRHRLRRRSPPSDGRADPPAPRHHAGDRADRLGQDDDALRLPRQDQLARSQHPHHRGSGRVPAGRHLADRGQREDRPDVRGGPALVPAPRSGRHHGRRDPRSRDRPRSRSRRR